MIHKGKNYSIKLRKYYFCTRNINSIVNYIIETVEVLILLILWFEFVNPDQICILSYIIQKIKVWVKKCLCFPVLKMHKNRLISYTRSVLKVLKAI